jgi:predicted aconitase
MFLTDDDQRILDGEKGAAPQKAMELVVRYGEIIGAEELCQVTWADLFCGSHAYLDVVPSTDFDEVFSRMALCTCDTLTLDNMAPGCICYSGVEPDCTEVPHKMLMTAEKKNHNLNILARFVDAGVILSGNCIPYLTGFVPVMGEHFVSCESSAVLFMNSVWGARGNGDGIEASFCAAVCGRTPRAGMHCRKSRAGSIEVKITTQPQNLHDWDMVGYALGTKLPPHAIPVFTGDFPKPNAISLKTFFASLACSAGTEMCHMVGLTPEAPDLVTAFQGRKNYPTIRLGRDEIEAAWQRLNENGRQSANNNSAGNKYEKLDYISIGCPHLHVEELRQIAQFLEDKKVHPGTQLDIWTTGPMRYMAQRCGYTDVIGNAGGHLLTGGCPSNRGYPQGTQTIALDSSKQRQDVPIDMGGENIFFGSRQTCLNSAVMGHWVG